MIYIDVDTAVELPVNVSPLTDDTDFKTIETGVAYNAAGMDLVWNFVTTAGVITQTAVTPTTAGDYDWTHIGDGMYKIEMPASGGASINNDTEGTGYFTGSATGVLPWRSPDFVFRAAGINDKLIDSAYDATRGLAGTALPAAAADAAGGIPISDAGGLALDTILDAAISTRSTLVATDIVSGGAITTSGGAVSNVTLVATTTTNSDMRGTNNALLAANVPLNFSSLAITAGTGYITGVTNNVNASVVGMSTVALAQFIGQDIGIYTLTEGSVFDTLRDAVIADVITELGNLNDVSAGDVADAVWDEATADHTTAGTFGAGVEVTTASAVNLIGPAVWAQPWSNYNVGDTNMGNLMENVLNPTSGFIYDMAGSSFDTSTDSLEAIRDRGDAAWITGGGGGGGGDATEAKQDTIISTLADMSGATFDTSTDSLEAIRNRGDAAWINSAGGGPEEYTITITSAGSPVDGAFVVVSSSALSDSPAVASGYTDGTGQVTFRLDPGTYYAWAQRNGVDFTNPTAFTVTA